LAALILARAGIVEAVADRQSGNSDFSRDIGITALSPKRNFCLAIKNRDLKPGQVLTLIWIPIAEMRQAPEIFFTIVRKRLAPPCDPVNSSPGEAAYGLDVEKLQRDKIYITIVGRLNDLRVDHATVRGKIGASQQIEFRSCSSLEGVHFSAWSGGALTRKRVWHFYHYLGYDVEPTCTDADFKE
jgi:hypothetical protein